MCVCVYVCSAVGGSWPAGRGSSKVIVFKGIGRRELRATALREGDVRRTNPKLLHSTHQGTEGNKAGSREERGDTRESDRTNRVGREMYKKHFTTIYTKPSGSQRHSKELSCRNIAVCSRDNKALCESLESVNIPTCWRSVVCWGYSHRMSFQERLLRSVQRT